MLYEYKKILKNKFIIVLLLGIIVIPAVMSMIYAKNHASWEKKGADISSKYYHQKYEEGIFPEVEELYNQYILDRMSKESIGYGSIDSCLNIYKGCLDYRKQMVERINMLNEFVDEYTFKINEYLLEQYSQPVEFYLYDNYYINTMIIDSRNWIMVIPILTICFIAISIFYADRENNTQILVYSSKYGRTRTYTYKVMCILSFATVIMIVYNTMRLLPQFVYGDMVDFLQPIQSIGMFMESPYNMNNITFLICMTLMQILAVFLLALVSVVLVNIFRKVLVPLCCTVLISGVAYFGYFYLFMKSISTNLDIDVVMLENLITNIKKFTPLYQYFSPLAYFEKYMHVNVFGYPISYIWFSVSFIFILVVILYVVGLLLYNYRFRRS